MGYSPGEFKIKMDGQEIQVHWELKGDGRIILWTHDEMKKILELDQDNAPKASVQLSVLMSMHYDD